jgi:hypothetical protein
MLQRTHGNAYTQRVLQRARQPGATGADPISTIIDNGIQSIDGAGIQRETVQRVVIQSGAQPQTLYQDYEPGKRTEKTDDFRPNVYTGRKGYDLTRTGDTSANVNVKILFRNRKRKSGSDYEGEDSEIPAGDTRRTWATQMCADLVTLWNGKFILEAKLITTPPAGGSPAPATGTPPSGTAPTGTPPTPAPTPAPTGGAPAGGTPAPAGSPPAPTPPAAAPTEVKLPIVFTATPIWSGDAGGDTHKVYLHDVTADPEGGQPIDAGNYYTKKGDSYSAEDKAIYAHEYGHLLGLPDEYSRSNPQMHEIFHKLSPTQEVAMNKALDKATMAQMALRAMMPALRRSFAKTSQQVADGVAGQRAAFVAAASAAVTSAWADPTLKAAVRSGINVDQFDLSTLAGQYAREAPWWSWLLTTPVGAMLIGRSKAREKIGTSLDAGVNAAVAGIDANGLAGQGFSGAITPGSIAGILSAMMTQAATSGDVQVPFTNTAGVAQPLNVTVETAKTLENATTRGSDISDAANQMAQGVTGEQPPAVGPGGTPLPQLAPPGSLTDKLATSMNGVDATRMNTYLTGEFTTAALQTQIRQQITAALAAGSPFAGAGVSEIEARIKNLVNGATIQAGQAITTGILRAFFNGPVKAAVSTLKATLVAEAETVLNSPPAIGAPPPAVQTAVNKIMTRVSEIKQKEDQALKAAGSEPSVGSGAAETRATVNSMMGNTNASTMVRADYMDEIKNSFNQKLRDSAREEEFTVKNV